MLIFCIIICIKNESLPQALKQRLLSIHSNIRQPFKPKSFSTISLSTSSSLTYNTKFCKKNKKQQQLVSFTNGVLTIVRLSNIITVILYKQIKVRKKIIMQHPCQFDGCFYISHTIFFFITLLLKTYPSK